MADNYLLPVFHCCLPLWSSLHQLQSPIEQLPAFWTLLTLKPLVAGSGCMMLSLASESVKTTEAWRRRIKENALNMFDDLLQRECDGDDDHLRNAEESKKSMRHGFAAFVGDCEIPLEILCQISHSCKQEHHLAPNTCTPDHLEPQSQQPASQFHPREMHDELTALFHFEDQVGVSHQTLYGQMSLEAYHEV
ncbi:hypothetical protein ACFXTH_024453 [Malus domestica]